MNNNWLEEFTEELKAIITEGVFSSNWIYIETWHSVGKRIVEEEETFKKNGFLKEEIVDTVAEALHKSPRTIYRAVQFYKKFPNLDKLPEGKNINWHRLVNKYLPEGGKEPIISVTSDTQAREENDEVLGQSLESLEERITKGIDFLRKFKDKSYTQPYQRAVLQFVDLVEQYLTQQTAKKLWGTNYPLDKPQTA